MELIQVSDVSSISHECFGRRMHVMRRQFALRLLRRRTVVVWALLVSGVAARADEPTPPAVVVVAAKSEPAILAPTTVPLDFVTDRTDLAGDADLDAYYGLLDYVRRVDPQELAAAARQTLVAQWKSSEFAEWSLEEFQFYYDLTQRPQAYRGKPVTLFGHVRLHHVDHPKNQYGIDPVHIAYLYTEDSQHHPVRVVFTENPDGVPVGEEVTSGISVTGYFLKLYRYEDRDGKGRFMPLVIAKSIHWTPPQPLSLPRWLQGVLAATAVAALGGIFWWVKRNRRLDAESRERERRMLGADRPPDFSAIGT